MRIALVSDAWAPQVNGVVRTLAATVARLRARGHAVETITPDQFASVACPGYREIRLAVRPRPGLGQRLAAFAPDAIHLATEGPLGWAARRWCLARGRPFTTSYHTHFPAYLALRTRLPADWFWPAVRRFHAPAARLFAATATLERELAARGLARTHRWSRGVDTGLFRPDGPAFGGFEGLPGPVLLYVGRLAVEKNIDAFLALPNPGSKVVVGDGPAAAALRRRWPDAHFLGPLGGERLAAAYRTADLLVFPSRTDTFGLVTIEALASGTPVAALPVPGPLDIAAGRPVIALDEDLGAAVARGLTLDRAACVAVGRSFSWEACTDQFVDGLSVAGVRALAGLISSVRHPTRPC